MPQQHAEVDPAEGAAQPRSRTSMLDLRLGRLDQPSVRHTGRADRLARTAVETEIEMPRDGVAELDAALGERLDQEDPAARRVHLGAELRERRTVGETEAAVHALVDALD